MQACLPGLKPSSSESSRGAWRSRKQAAWWWRPRKSGHASHGSGIFPSRCMPGSGCVDRQAACVLDFFSVLVACFCLVFSSSQPLAGSPVCCRAWVFLLALRDKLGALLHSPSTPYVRGVSSIVPCLSAIYLFGLLSFVRGSCWNLLRLFRSRTF
jgi:hypothetical protein